jgi:cytochrome c2
MKRILPVLLVLVPAICHAENDIAFRLRGKPIKTMTLAEVEALVPPQAITVFEPHEMKEVTYKVIPVNALFDKIYGDAWKHVDEALFTCKDGYQPEMPVERFLKYRGLFAVERTGAEFSVIKLAEGSVKADLGPLYLIWDNASKPELRAEDLLNWPYQVTTVDFVTFDDRFPHMVPPKGSTTKVKRGFQEFRRNCFACHAVNGDGGKKAIDLNQPVNPTQYFKEPWLKKWIMNPASMRPGTQMPPLAVQGKEGEKVTDEIIAYLRAMARPR